MTQATHHFCPHCGYDLVLDAPVLINDFSMMGAMSQLWWRDQPIGTLTGTERMICYTLMKAYPAAVRTSVILDRIDSEGEGKILNVYVFRIRKKLREAGAPNPIQAMLGRGPHPGQESAFSWVAGAN